MRRNHEGRNASLVFVIRTIFWGGGGCCQPEGIAWVEVGALAKSLGSRKNEEGNWKNRNITACTAKGDNATNLAVP